ncbi:MAG TPA: ATP-binding protein, partial [Blastocatellia bacterium]
SLIAMVSEVAGGHVDAGNPRLKEWFSTIATTSRDTVDAMSDIVWAVNPKRDQLQELTNRMRHFAEDILGARDVDLNFRASEASRGLKAGADLRREVFLIFKESVNNIVRHSECTSAEVEVRTGGGWLTLVTTDNGRGFDPSGVEGNGLANMRNRARKLGGSLEVVSGNGPTGRGTTVVLRVPLKA